MYFFPGTNTAGSQEEYANKQSTGDEAESYTINGSGMKNWTLSECITQKNSVKYGSYLSRFDLLRQVWLYDSAEYDMATTCLERPLKTA